MCTLSLSTTTKRQADSVSATKMSMRARILIRMVSPAFDEL